MFYSNELSYFLNLIKEFRFPHNIISAENLNSGSIDGGIRELIKPSYNQEEYLKAIFKHTKNNTIYTLTDEFLCCYVFFRLPDTSPEKLVIIGPYTQREISYEKLLKESKKRKINLAWLPSLEMYFSSVNYIPDDYILFTPLQILGEKMWGENNFTRQSLDFLSAKEHNEFSFAFSSQPQKQLDFNLSIIEKRYQNENMLIENVKKGKTHQAQAMLSLFTPASVEHRAAEPTRNAKNYLIILNTLMRKAVEQSGVHPIHIDRLSSSFAKKIENITSWSQIAPICKSMASLYCKAVNDHNLKGYSSSVQKAIAIIDFDLTAELSLSSLARQLNVNSAYLSAQFKKQVGLTVTDYVSLQRIDMAKLLLKSTDMSIGEVAQRCGITDSNYFSKLFKKHTGLTPKSFRLI